MSELFNYSWTLVHLVIDVVLIVLLYKNNIDTARQQASWDRDCQEIRRVLDKIKKTLPDK